MVDMTAKKDINYYNTDQIIMCLYVEVICKIQTMYVTNLRSGLEYIVKEQNDLAKDYYKKIAQPVRV